MLAQIEVCYVQLKNKLQDYTNNVSEENFQAKSLNTETQGEIPSHTNADNRFFPIVQFISPNIYSYHTSGTVEGCPTQDSIYTNTDSPQDNETQGFTKTESDENHWLVKEESPKVVYTVIDPVPGNDTEHIVIKEEHLVEEDFLNIKEDSVGGYQFDFPFPIEDGESIAFEKVAEGCADLFVGASGGADINELNKLITLF